MEKYEGKMSDLGLINVNKKEIVSFLRIKEIELSEKTAQLKFNN